jgi:hypothetical protein
MGIGAGDYLALRLGMEKAVSGSSYAQYEAAGIDAVKTISLE